jgi:hypothetical protein
MRSGRLGKWAIVLGVFAIMLGAGAGYQTQFLTSLICGIVSFALGGYGTACVLRKNQEETARLGRRLSDPRGTWMLSGCVLSLLGLGLAVVTILEWVGVLRSSPG